MSIDSKEARIAWRVDMVLVQPRARTRLVLNLHDRDVTLPPSVRAGELELRALGVQPHHFDSHPGDLAHRDVVARGDVVGRDTGAESRVAASRTASTTSATWMYDLLCRPSPRIAKMPWIARQPAKEVIAHSVSLTGADDVAEPKNEATKTEHVAVRGDQGFSGQLAGAIGGNRQQRTMVLVNLLLTKVPVDATPGRVHDPSRTRQPHSFQNMVSQNSSGIEIDRRFDRRSRDVGIRCQVDDRVNPCHCGSEAVEVGDVPANDTQPAVLRVPIEVPFPPGGEIVENGHRFG